MDCRDYTTYGEDLEWGKFRVEIIEGRGDASKAELSAGHRYSELFFGLEIESGEFIFLSNADGETHSKHQIS
jgi:hypothetical protein